MVGVTEVSAAYEALKAAISITKAATGLKTTTEINLAVLNILSALVEDQTAALQEQEQRFILNRIIEELRDQLRAKEAWAAEKSRYLLAEFPSGTFAYVLG